MEQFTEFFSENLILFFALFLILFFLVRSWLPSSVKPLKPAEAIRLANQGAVYLDVRTDDEYKQGHILDSQHIPLGLLSGRANELEDLKDKPLIIYCRTGARSSQAGSVLKKLGFIDLYHIQGGISAWMQGNLPVTKKESKTRKKNKPSSDDESSAEPVASSEIPKVLMYSTQSCPYCLRAKNLFQDKGVVFEEIDVNGIPGKRKEMQTRSGRSSVPQIFIDNHHVGGCDDLYELEHKGELDSLLGLSDQKLMVVKTNVGTGRGSSEGSESANSSSANSSKGADGREGMSAVN